MEQIANWNLEGREGLTENLVLVVYTLASVALSTISIPFDGQGISDISFASAGTCQ